MILLPIIGPLIARRLLAAKPGRTDQRATFLASVISWAGLALVAFALFMAWNWWDNRNAGAQGKQDSRSAAALAATAQDAAATVIAQAEKEATVDDLVAAAIEEIDNAPTDQAADAAARAAICGMPEYRDDPGC